MSRRRNWEPEKRQVRPMDKMEPMLLQNGKQYVFTIPDGSYIRNVIANHNKYKLIFDKIKEMMLTDEYREIRKDGDGLPIVSHTKYAEIIEKAFEKTPYRWLPENEIYIRNTNDTNVLTVSHIKVSRWNLPKPDKKELAPPDKKPNKTLGRRDKDTKKKEDAELEAWEAPYKKALAEYQENEKKLDRSEGIGMSVQEWGELAREDEEARQAEIEAERLASMPPPPPPKKKKEEPKHDSFESDDELDVTRITYDKYTLGDNRGKKRKPKTYLKTNKTDKRNEYYQIFTDDEDNTAIGEMTDDGDINFHYQGYDSETDRLHSEYPYEIITEYQENPETIAKYKALHNANKALTKDQRDHGWQAEWNESRKEPYYFNTYHSEHDTYESHGTETKLDDGHDTIYEPYDVNSLPNYNGFMGDPLPSNNSKKAPSVTAPSVAAPSVTAPSVTEGTGLPPGWTEQFSKSKNRTYWFNTNTGAQSWTKPTSGGKKKRKSKRKLNKKSKRKTKKN